MVTDPDPTIHAHGSGPGNPGFRIWILSDACGPGTHYASFRSKGCACVWSCCVHVSGSCWPSCRRRGCGEDYVSVLRRTDCDGTDGGYGYGTCFCHARPCPASAQGHSSQPDTLLRRSWSRPAPWMRPQHRAGHPSPRRRSREASWQPTHPPPFQIWRRHLQCRICLHRHGGLRWKSCRRYPSLCDFPAFCLIFVLL